MTLYKDLPPPASITICAVARAAAAAPDVHSILHDEDSSFLSDWTGLAAGYRFYINIESNELYTDLYIKAKRTALYI